MYFTKECSTCNTEKTIDNFSLNRSSKDGLRSECKQCFKEYRQRNKKYFQNHQRINRGRYNASKNAYAMREKGQAPKISEKEKNAIIALYVKAQLLTEETGILHHVDHIIPRSKGGLHVLSNLQILTAKENMSKYTKSMDEWEGSK